MTEDHYAVVGNPIAHSKSPDIHRAFAAQTHQALRYEKYLWPEDGFRDHARVFFQDGGKGLNVTLPFKEQAYGFAQQLSERAQLAGAVNTLKALPDGSILGDNTDGAGLVADLKRLGWPLASQRILVLGAGGAVRGVLGPILHESPGELVITNRTHDKAQTLAALFAALGNVQANTSQSLQGTFDVIINGTSASVQGALPDLPKGLVGPKTRLYDMMYAPQDTAFLAWGKQQGAEACADGLGMLVGQAAEAFFLWRGVRPDVTGVLAQLNAQLRGNTHL
jgi:shikimate dehydrogenase